MSVDVSMGAGINANAEVKGITTTDYPTGREGSLTPIPLIAPQRVREFSPTNFRNYVISLKQNRTKRKSRTAKPYALTVRKLKSGEIRIRTKRALPKYATEAELATVGEKLGLPLNEVFILLRSEGFVILKTHFEAKCVQREIGELPW